jgi:hypothetical protein
MVIVEAKSRKARTEFDLFLWICENVVASGVLVTLMVSIMEREFSPVAGFFAAFGGFFFAVISGVILKFINVPVRLAHIRIFLVIFWSLIGIWTDLAHHRILPSI